jgi:hypothetical protein
MFARCYIGRMNFVKFVPIVRRCIPFRQFCIKPKLETAFHSENTTKLLTDGKETQVKKETIIYDILRDATIGTTYIVGGIVGFFWGISSIAILLVSANPFPLIITVFGSFVILRVLDQ